MGDVLWASLCEALWDSLKLLPFLLVTYLLMELLEQKAGARSAAVVRRAGHWGPLVGGVLGAVPQCGFSAAAASLYAGRVLTVGTLIAVFLSTSDEMLPILLGGLSTGQITVAAILKIMGIKVLMGIVTGFLIDLLYTGLLRRRQAEMDIHQLCEQEHAGFEGGVFRSALIHTAKVFVYIALISFVIEAVVGLIGEEALSRLFTDLPVVGELIAALIGLIPNCAASVVITELYLAGVIGPGAMMAGLLTGAGVGLLVLFRVNRRPKENLIIVGVLLAAGVLWGVLIEAIGLVF